MYTSHESHSADCKKYPFEKIPKNIFLDTNVINIIVKYPYQIFEHGNIPLEVPISRAKEIEALLHIFQVGQRACWDIYASEKSLEEISQTSNSDLKYDLSEYAHALIDIHSSGSSHSRSLGRRISKSSIFSALPDANDRELLGNAIGLGCDAFCTCDHKTIIRKRHLLPKLALRILNPIEWWHHIKQWAGLWC
ncbi:hypothetical protein [Methylobacterium terrae]|uniref:hypothetical protein n=1 Tax=Methylobacterium terrae TaxID=2202827 RepID=UPI0013A543BA|nr:hypothetical protein [Methylobacterium terrae]